MINAVKEKYSTSNVFVDIKTETATGKENLDI